MGFATRVGRINRGRGEGIDRTLQEILLHVFAWGNALLLCLLLAVVGEEKGLYYRKHHKELSDNQYPQDAPRTAQPSEAIGI